MRRCKRATHVTLVVEAKVNIMADLYINGESAFEIQELYQTKILYSYCKKINQLSREKQQ